MNDTLEEAARIIAGSKNLIAFTGSGISAESGIPTFRGKDGLWNKYNPAELATFEAFINNPKVVWEWYSWRINLVLNAKPNLAHEAIARLENAGILKVVITQNVDDLHERAGTKNLIKLHGDILIARCISCNYKERLSESPRNIPPRCPVCGGLLRPDVVWFGEPLPTKELKAATEAARKADVILVVGTSGVVYPACLIPFVVKNAGGKVIEVNISESAITEIADVFFKGPASRVLSALVSRVNELLKK
ncbi:MAG: NAD-dependent protein deacetylase [Candidatus Korarchaeota archaeon]